MDSMALARDERADLLALLEVLSPGEWEAPSLCEGWRVRDVVAHLIGFDVLSWPQTVGQFVRGGFSTGRINQLGVDAARGLTTDQLLERVWGHLTPRGLTAGLGGRIGLTDAMVHHQDVRRALGHSRTVPAERLAVVLPFAVTAPTLRSNRPTGGLRLVATDLDWSTGSGPEVRGPGEALLMTIAGRPAAVADLEGPGVATVRERLGG